MAAATPLVSPERLIDLDHYVRTTGQTFADPASAYAHFRAEGQAAGLLPSPFLYTRWYLWQNPGCGRYPSVLDHFAARAATAPVDPAPFIDSLLFLRLNPQYPSMAEAMLALVEGRERAIAPALEDHLAALHAAQERVHGAIRSELLRDQGGERRRLVWIQSGTAFRPAVWFRPDRPRSWDLMCNWYTLSCLDLRFGEIHLRQSGTKATGIHHVLTSYPELLSRYHQVLFLDDDLGFVHDDLDLAFDIAENNGLDLFQPAVAPGSHCVWPDLFQVQGSGFRRTTGVEIMMFGFSRRALARCAPLFGRSVSGFGLDFACSEVVRAEGWHCGVVDPVAAQHIEVIDETGGAYYELMRALGINQKLELFETILALEKVPTFVNVTREAEDTAAGFAGCDRDRRRHLPPLP